MFKTLQYPYNLSIILISRLCLLLNKNQTGKQITINSTTLPTCLYQSFYAHLFFILPTFHPPTLALLHFPPFPSPQSAGLLFFFHTLTHIMLLLPQPSLCSSAFSPLSAPTLVRWRRPRPCSPGDLLLCKVRFGVTAARGAPTRSRLDFAFDALTPAAAVEKRWDYDDSSARVEIRRPEGASKRKIGTCPAE